jgi:hypothetical protein
MTEIVSKMKPWHKDVMDRLMAGHDIEDIAKDMQMNVAYLKVITRSPLFQNEMKIHREVALKAVTERLEGFAQEALDKIVQKMRTSKQDSIQLQAAREILDRSGHTKPDTNTDTIQDAEAVIKALQRMKNKDTDDKSADSSNVDGGENGNVQSESIRDDSVEADQDVGRSGLVGAGEGLSGQRLGETVHQRVDGTPLNSLSKKSSDDDDMDYGAMPSLASDVSRGS